MSDQDKTTQIRECDGALDYLYGMLDGQDKARFEAHLAGCASCQAELESMGRVRSVAREGMPVVEPTQRLTGALHAQLMHAASQRQQKGKLLSFARKIVSHPGYAVAASVLIIGGVLGVQWSRGALMMPLAKHAEAPVTPTAAEPVAAPTAEKPAAMAKEKEAQPAEATGVEKGNAAAHKKIAKQDAPFDVTTAAPSQLPTPRPDVHAASPAAATRAPKDARDRYDYKSKGGDELDGLLLDDADSAGGRGTRADATKHGKASGGLAGKPTSQGVMGNGTTGSQSGARAFGNGDGAVGKQTLAQSAEPAEPMGSVGSGALNQEAPPRAAAPSRKAPSTGSSFADSAPEQERRPAPQPRARVAQEAPAAPPPSPTTSTNRTGPAAADDQVANNRATPSKAAAMEGEDSANRELAKAEGGAKNELDAIDADRQHARELARAGRCEEATTTFAAVERRAPDRLSAQDRLAYVGCLRTLGRLDPAQNELNQLRGNRQSLPLPAAKIQAEQKAIDADRKRQMNADSYDSPSSNESRHAAKKRSKAAPNNADSAPAAAPAKPAERKSGY